MIQQGLIMEDILKARIVDLKEEIQQNSLNKKFSKAPYVLRNLRQILGRKLVEKGLALQRI